MPGSVVFCMEEDGRRCPTDATLRSLLRVKVCNQPSLHTWALSCACVLLSAWCQLMLLLRALLQGISLHQPTESCARGLVSVHW